jgi:hypothetical protein
MNIFSLRKMLRIQYNLKKLEISNERGTFPVDITRDDIFWMPKSQIRYSTIKNNKGKNTYPKTEEN